MVYKQIKKNYSQSTNKITEGLTISHAIFCCRLIGVGSIYLILGFLYQRLVVGAKGMEQIPNYNFWRDFGSLQAVSFLFTLYSTMYPLGGGGGGTQA